MVHGSSRKNGVAFEIAFMAGVLVLYALVGFALYRLLSVVA